MPNITFYQQKRQDGGVRTAVTTSDETVLHHFEPGKKFSDPALLWFIDVRCQGARLPSEPEKVRQWLLDHSPAVRKALSELSEKLRAGLDVDFWPFLWEVPKPPRGVKMVVAFSAVRRVAFLNIANILTDLRDHWEEILGNLPVAEPASL